MNFIYRIFRIILVKTLCLIPLAAKSQQAELIRKPLQQIPHKTAYELWMWPHRAITYLITSEKPPAFDTAYITSYREKFILSIPISARTMSFDLFDRSVGRSLRYVPNFRYDVGIGVSTRWATFIINPGLAVYPVRQKEQGVSRHLDMQLNLYGKRTVSDIVYQNYEGFYLANTSSYLEGQQPITRKDIRAISLNMNTYYVFNHTRFSYRSSFAFTEKQKKSCGSALAGVYYTLFGVTADSSLIPQQIRTDFEGASNVVEGGFQTFGVTCGYIHTFRLGKNFFSTASLVPGGGLSQTTYDRLDSTSYRSDWQFSAKANGRVAVGFDEGKWFGGVLGIYDYLFFPEGENASFNYNYGKFMVYVGYRFDFLKTERKILRKLDLIGYEGDPGS